MCVVFLCVFVSVGRNGQSLNELASRISGEEEGSLPPIGRWRGMTASFASTSSTPDRSSSTSSHQATPSSSSVTDPLVEALQWTDHHHHHPVSPAASSLPHLPNLPLNGNGSGVNGSSIRSTRPLSARPLSARHTLSAPGSPRLTQSTSSLPSTTSNSGSDVNRMLGYETSEEVNDDRDVNLSDMLGVRNHQRPPPPSTLIPEDRESNIKEEDVYAEEEEDDW